MEITHMSRKIGEKPREHESVLVRPALDTSPILGDFWVTPRGRHGQPRDMGGAQGLSLRGARNRSVLAACPGSTGDGEPEKTLPQNLLETAACSGWAAFSSHQANVGAGVSLGLRL